ncbi:MAG TPA: hypothetical protein VFR97_14475 [Capillimicrobium sp.]|nr:hypothetical protein [Capillimicrobium sp.]
MISTVIRHELFDVVVPMLFAVLVAEGLLDRRAGGAAARTRIALGAVVAIVLAGIGVGLVAMTSAVPQAWQGGVVVVAFAVGVLWLVGRGVAGWIPVAPTAGRRPVTYAAAAFVLAVIAALTLVALRAGTSAVGSKVHATYRVQGTCAAGSCGLHRRRLPGSSFTSYGRLPDESEVVVICQTLGEPMPGDRSGPRVWDRLADGTYIFDRFVSTSGRGTFDPMIDRCPEPPDPAPGPAPDQEHR